MKERKIKKYMLSAVFFMSISLICLISYALIGSNKVANYLKEKNITYVSYEILTDNVVPVMNTSKENITRPYKDETVTIGENYYDYKAESKDQENSITYYEGTYIQNKGIDYISKDVFKVYSVADGKVISVTEDDVNGKTIKIQHNNNLISVYQSIDEITVNENETVSKGQQIAQSSTNNFGSKLGNHLHFELYNNDIPINPEEYFINNEG